MTYKIAYVLTVGFGANDAAPIEVALDEVLKLHPYRVFVIHDRKGRSGRYARAAVESRMAAYAEAGVPLEVVKTDQDETTLRWRAGVVENAFEDLAVDAVFVFATDFDKFPTDSARQGWLKMAALAGPNRVAMGQYQPKPGSFKDEFYGLVARAAVEAIFPEEAPALIGMGIRQFRTEFFVLGRSILERLRRDSIHWNMDPTTDIALTCLRYDDLALHVVDLGSFEDRADTRDPLGEFFQIERYVFQLLINLARYKRSKGLDRASQIRVYEELIPVIERGVEVARYALRRNLERLKTNPKVGVFRAEAAWDERWVPSSFRGFSYVLDNPGSSLLYSRDGLPYLSCDMSKRAAKDLALYRRLAEAVRGLGAALRPFSSVRSIRRRITVHIGTA